MHLAAAGPGTQHVPPGWGRAGDARSVVRVGGGKRQCDQGVGE